MSTDTWLWILVGFVVVPIILRLILIMILVVVAIGLVIGATVLDRWDKPRR